MLFAISCASLLACSNHFQNSGAVFRFQLRHWCNVQNEKPYFSSPGNIFWAHCASAAPHIAFELPLRDCLSKSNCSTQKYIFAHRRRMSNNLKVCHSKKYSIFAFMPLQMALFWSQICVGIARRSMIWAMLMHKWPSAPRSKSFRARPWK